MFIHLWVHGHHLDNSKPVEVDIFNVTGEKIDHSVLNLLLDNSKRGHEIKLDWFGDLPTEKALSVETDVSFDEDAFGGVKFATIGFFELPPYNS